MMLPTGITLLATVCNTTPNAVPYTLWLARREEQYLVDLSDELGQSGDLGLTGLTSHDEKFYVAVQSRSPRVLVLDRRLAVIDVIASPAFADIHSIHAAGDSLIVCSTGTQSVLHVDLANHQATELCKFEATIHLNSACFDGSDLLLCCHYPGRVVPEAVGGGVIAASNRRVALAGLDQPHSLQSDGRAFLVLDSDGRRLIRFDHTGILQQQNLSGFLRGIAVAHGSLFIASSAGRIISRKNPSVPAGGDFWDMAVPPVCLHELDKATLQPRATHFPLVAGFEIYDLLALEDETGVTPPRERLQVPEIHAMARCYYEATKRALTKMHQRR